VVEAANTIYSAGFFLTVSVDSMLKVRFFLVPCYRSDIFNAIDVFMVFRLNIESV
jgi:hypothetical protein